MGGEVVGCTHPTLAWRIVYRIGDGRLVVVAVRVAPRGEVDR